MKKQPKIKLHIALLVLFGLSVFPAAALNATLPPGANFDLSHWYLQLPTSNNLLTASAGSVDSFSAAQLVAGTTNSYFYTGVDGAMTFWVPDNGATTSGSSHPRSELRELLNPNTTSLNWTCYGTHILTAQCKVLQLPADTQKVCIGQIHEPSYLTDGITPGANNEQMIMFDLSSQKIYANINLDGNQSSSFSQTFVSGSGVATNTLINYTMAISNGLLTIIVNNITNAWNLFSGTNYQGHTATNWGSSSGNAVYFKAGDYNQTANTCNCANDGSRVTFYSLTAYHAPAITNQPANKTGLPGGTVTFTVGAIGNGALSYQWLLNGTNLLPAATNASLTLSNLSGANLGNYAVAVSDSTPDFHSVTSSVAALTGNFPPAITSQPVSLSVAAGSNVTFSIVASGSAPLTNHWWFNSTNNLSWASGSTLVITNVRSANGGNYFVVIDNAYGAVTSAIAQLTIKLPPTITGAIVSNQTFQISYTGAPLASYLVQAKTNLFDAAWLTIGTNVADSNGFNIFFDVSRTNYLRRFYRLMAP